MRRKNFKIYNEILNYLYKSINYNFCSKLGYLTFIKITPVPQTLSSPLLNTPSSWDDTPHKIP